MAKKFDFLSPGIEIREIDQSFIPAEREAEGPIIIGRFRKGPANKPVRVRNLDDFVSVFGLPIPGGNGAQGDMWRDGNMVGPTYAAYAAQSWLASENSPITVVRLAGEQSPTNTGIATAKAGWSVGAGTNAAAGTNATAYGLFLIASGSQPNTMTTGSLAAVWYSTSGYLALSGAIQDGSDTQVNQAGTFIKNKGQNCEFGLSIHNSAGTRLETLSFNFNRNSSNYIRSVFNTNPQLTNTQQQPASTTKTYWLGESFAREVEDLSILNTAAGGVYGVLLPLQSGSVNWGHHQESAAEAYSGMVISQKEKGQVNLFQFKTLHVGEDIQKEYMIAIEEIAEPSNPIVNPYGTFTVCVKNMAGQSVEKYSGLTLNPSDPNYIAKRIGDQFIEWDETNRRYRTYGDFQNQSNIIYVDMQQFIRDGGGQGFLPAGFKGPVRPKGFTLSHNSSGAQQLGENSTLVNTKASITITIANGTSNTGTGPKNNQYLRLTMYGDAAGEAFDILFASGAAFADSAVTFTDDGDNTYSATIGISDSPTDDQIVAALETLFASRSEYTASKVQGGGSGASSVTITAVTAAVSTFDIANNGTAVSDVTVGSPIAGAIDTDNFANAFVQGNDSVPSTGGDTDNFVLGPTNFTASFLFPSLPLRANGTEGGAPDPYRAYYGIRPKVSSTSRLNDPDYCDYLRRLPASVSSFVADSAAGLEHSFTFTLDDLVIVTGSNTVTYSVGSYDLGENVNGSSYTRSSGSFGDLLDLNVRQFLMPLFGGSEGFDITQKEPLRDDLINNTRDDQNYYVHYTLNKAIDAVRDPEVVPANLLLMPGIRKPVITNRLISVAEDRKDVLALIDLEGDYKPRAERVDADTDSTSLGSVSTAVSQIKQRNLNSSFGAAFYPWVQISDNLNGSQLLWVPPSVAALGAIGKSQATSELWFAPAGFNRGGLGSLGGSRGPRVLQARQRLDSKERDSLYEVNINPIATFPAEGVVIFGQKTLQADQSALDRINVRRLVLYLKSQVSAVARNLLFDQNVQSTWNRFTGQVEPILQDTQARFGLTSYKLVLDDTTTTADLIDRNIMYAKIFIQPARAIEFIVVDFVITRTGADFV